MKINPKNKEEEKNKHEEIKTNLDEGQLKLIKLIFNLDLIERSVI